VRICRRDKEVQEELKSKPILFSRLSVFRFHLSVRLPSRSRATATSAAASEGTAHETSATTAAATSKHGTHHHATHHGVSVVVVGLVILPDNGVSAIGAEQGLSD
jgi:hypothetical protein